MSRHHTKVTAPSRRGSASMLAWSSGSRPPRRRRLQPVARHVRRQHVAAEALRQTLGVLRVAAADVEHA
jgi:hypothetical protein